MSLKLDIDKDIKPYFYIRGNFDLLKCTNNIKFNSVLDVGTGKGGAALYFANQGKKVTTITLGEEFHSYREDWFNKLNIDVTIGDFANYKTQEKYDAIWMSHSLEHTQCPGKFLKNAWDMLEDDGWLFVLVPPYNHLLTNGHYSTGWNMGTLMYNLLVSGFNIKDGHFARYGSNLCAFVQKKSIPYLEEGGYISILDSKKDWPLSVKHHSSLENIYKLNWFSNFEDKFKKEENIRKAYKKEESLINDVYISTIINSEETSIKFNNFIKKFGNKKIICYGAGYFAKEIIKKFDFSKLNIIGFIDGDSKKVGQTILNYKIHSIKSIKELKPDIILMTSTKKMWGMYHVIPIQAKTSIKNIIFEAKVFSIDPKKKDISIKNKENNPIREQTKIYFEKLTDTIQNIDIKEIEQCVKVLLKAYENGNNIFICGNGGSAATASHFACDINKGVSYGLEKKFKVIPLTDSLSTITAYTNDVDYNVIFVEQLKNFFQEGDVIIGISGSGNSQNVLNAMEYVNNNGGITIGWTGFSGGKLKEISKYSVNANIDDMQVSEDIHMILTHLMMKTLRKSLTGSEAYY